MPRSGKMVFVGFASQEAENDSDQRNANKRRVGECSIVRYWYSKGTLHPWENEKHEKRSKKEVPSIISQAGATYCFHDGEECFLIIFHHWILFDAGH